MQLLTEVADLNELNHLRFLFESKGILIYIANEDSARNFSFFHPSGRYAIHVVFDEQFADAQKLLEDENHEVQHPVDVEAYQKHIEESEPAIRSILIKKALFLAVLLVLIIIGVEILLAFLYK